MSEAKKLKMLAVCSYYHPAVIYGGPVPAMHRLNLALTARGHEVTVYTTDANGREDLKVPLEQPVWTDGLSVTYFPRWWFGQARKPFSLFISLAMGNQLVKLEGRDYDLVLIHSSYGFPGWKAAGAARKVGLPYICYTHGGYEPWALHHKYWKKKAYLSLFEKTILQQAKGLVVCNQAEADTLQQGLGVQTLVRRIPWGTDLPESERIPPREAVEARWPSLSGVPFLLFLSRLHPKKGLGLLLPAFAAISGEFPEWRLVLAGPDEGGSLAQVRRWIGELNLEEKVLLTGMVQGESKAALLGQAEFLVLPSYSEGFPVVVAEALGYGRPVVITDTCYVPEVEAEGAGLVVPAQVEALRGALRRMMTDPQGRRLMGHRALELARKQFSWGAVAEKTIAFYREVL